MSQRGRFPVTQILSHRETSPLTHAYPRLLPPEPERRFSGCRSWLGPPLREGVRDSCGLTRCSEDGRFGLSGGLKEEGLFSGRLRPEFPEDGRAGKSRLEKGSLSGRDGRRPSEFPEDGRWPLCDGKNGISR